MTKKIVVFTSSEIRHDAFRIYLSNAKGIQVVKSYSEEGKILNKKILEKNTKQNFKQINHLKLRQKCEEKFFLHDINFLKDKSNNERCDNGFISTKSCLKEIENLDPELIVVYGSSLIKGDIINKFNNKILNVHLGLSPYYRGSGTNYFPFVLNEPEYAGATFMFLDEGVDTGKIIHQIRPRIFSNDDFHTIGTRLIKDMFNIYIQIIINFSSIKMLDQSFPKGKRYLFKMKDFTIESLEKLNINFKNNMVKKYLREKDKRDQKVPIKKQQWINEIF